MVDNNDSFFGTRDAYQRFFPIAGLSLLIGALLWMYFGFTTQSWYPREAHGSIMFFSGLWAYVAGFLMTAIPRMTGTETPRAAVQSVGIALTISQVVLSTLNQPRIAAVLVFFQMLFLISFLISRFIKRPRIPFEGFVFVPLAMLAAVTGSALYAAGGISTTLYFQIAGEIFILNLICGLGSRLIPMLSRLPKAIAPDAIGGEKKYRYYIFAATALNLSYVLEWYGYFDFGAYLRIATLLLHSIKRFGLLQLPPSITALGLGLKAGILMLLFSQVMNLSYFNSGLAARHLLYIGAFMLITVMISFRVMIAHSGSDTEYERRSPRMFVIMGLMLTAATLRWQAGANPFSPLMVTAAILFSLSVALWLQKFWSIHRKS